MNRHHLVAARSSMKLPKLFGKHNPSLITKEGLDVAVLR
jgi:hypothetical protein